MRGEVICFRDLSFSHLSFPIRAWLLRRAERAFLQYHEDNAIVWMGHLTIQFKIVKKGFIDKSNLRLLSPLSASGLADGRVLR